MLYENKFFENPVVRTGVIENDLPGEGRHTAIVVVGHRTGQPKKEPHVRTRPDAKDFY